MSGSISPSVLLLDPTLSGVIRCFPESSVMFPVDVILSTRDILRIREFTVFVHGNLSILTSFDPEYFCFANVRGLKVVYRSK